jgi:hypothetical protein
MDIDEEDTDMLTSLLQSLRPHPLPTPLSRQWRRLLENAPAQSDAAESGGWFESSLELRQGLFVQDLSIEGEAQAWDAAVGGH